MSNVAAAGGEGWEGRLESASAATNAFASVWRAEEEYATSLPANLRPVSGAEVGAVLLVGALSSRKMSVTDRRG